VSRSAKLALPNSAAGPVRRFNEYAPEICLFVVITNKASSMRNGMIRLGLGALVLSAVSSLSPTAHAAGAVTNRVTHIQVDAGGTISCPHNATRETLNTARILES
jgi:hypothetical protein